MNRQSIRAIQRALIVAVGLGVSGASSAEESGKYFGVGFGQATLDENLCAGDPSCSSDVTDTAFRFFFGNRISEHAAIEFGYRDLGTASLSTPFLGSTLTGKWESTGFDFSLVASSPITPTSSLFFRIGLFNWNVDMKATLGAASGTESDSGMDLFFGFGGEYMFSKSVGMRIEYEAFTVGDNSSTGEGDINVISASLIGRF